MSRAMQEDIANLYEFLYHVTTVVTFQVKSCPESFFSDFVDWKLVLILIKSNQPFCLLIMRSFLNFLLILRICCAERIRGISENFLIFKTFLFPFLKSWRHFLNMSHRFFWMFDFEVQRKKIYLSILQSREPCCYAIFCAKSCPSSISCWFCRSKLVSTLICSTLSFNPKFSVPIVSEISQGKFYSVFLVKQRISYLDSTIWDMITVKMKHLQQSASSKQKLKSGCQKAAQAGYVSLI